MSALQPRRRWRRRLGGAALAWLAVCAVGEWTTSHQPAPGAAARVLCAPLLQPLGLLARHCWFVLEGTERWDVWQDADAGGTSWGHVHRNLLPPEAEVGGGPAVEVGALDGVAGAAFVQCVRAAAPVYADRATYRAWPGPNSNTFVDAMLRRCGWPLRLPATAIGKDWRGWIGASAWGPGVQVESPLVGLAVGLDLRAELHVLALTFGIDFWPPAVLVPFGGGRFGFSRDAGR